MSFDQTKVYSVAIREEGNVIRIYVNGTKLVFNPDPSSAVGLKRSFFGNYAWSDFKQIDGADQILDRSYWPDLDIRSQELQDGSQKSV